MFELFLDSADVAQITRFNACLPVAGVTTNPSILAKAGIGLNGLSLALTELLGPQSRLCAQLLSPTVDGMVEEGRRLRGLPGEIIVKVPATEQGLAAIRKMKAENMTILATAIYSVQQGFMAALCGADYLAPYVNRIDMMGADGCAVVGDLQLLLDRNHLPCKLLPASFKNSQQVVDVLKTGVAAITLPVDIVAQLFEHPAVGPAEEKFARDWQGTFPDKLSFES